MPDLNGNGWAKIGMITKAAAAIVAILAAFWTFIVAPTTRVIAREEADKAVAVEQRQLDRMEQKLNDIERYLREKRL